MQVKPLIIINQAGGKNIFVTGRVTGVQEKQSRKRELRPCPTLQFDNYFTQKPRRNMRGFFV